MARALAATLTAVLVAAAWLRLERGPAPLRELAPIVGLALLPALAVALTPRRIVVALVLAASTLSAASVAFEIPLTDARPRDPDRNFFGPVLEGMRQGFLEFYDTGFPFDRLEFPLMHALVLLAVFAFIAVAAMLVAAWRSAAAALVLLVGAGWPTTIVPGERPLAVGALILAGVLALLFLVRAEARPGRGLAQAGGAGLVLVLVAVAASTSDAVAKPAFLEWRAWDLYDRPADPVSVAYVWDSHYGGISFPEKETVVLTVRVPGPKRSLYWRATILDEHTGMGWRESLDLGPAAAVEEIDVTLRDALLPKAAEDEENWIRQEVTVGALSDNHLIASAQPVKWRPGTSAPVRVGQSGVVVLSRPLRQGQRYTAWSYVPRAKPSQLAKVRGLYPGGVARYLDVLPGVRVPAFHVANRPARMERIFAEHALDFLMSSYRPLYETAREVVGKARSPYAAAVALEAWFRNEGGFTYDEQPPPTGALPPLVAFVTRTKRGYCQFYAGAMAAMLRLLGVPARVAAGFTSGDYDEKRREWTVTDRNAHTWVEVYFPGFGWLPFDPTPGRGELAAPYSAVSPAFDTRDAAGALGGSDTLDRIRLEALRAQGRPGLEGLGVSPVPNAGGGAAVVREEGPSLFALALLVVSSGLLGLTALKALRRELRLAVRDPRAVAAACRRDLTGFLADQRLTLPASTTPAEIGEVLQREFVVDAGPFVRSLTLARFGPPWEAEAASRRARRELRQLRRQLRRQLGLAERLRGAVSLRSLVV